LQRTFEKFEKAYKKLKEACSKVFEEKYEKEILVEVVTKRFEYTFESLWKLLKEILYTEGIECNTPLSCFKEAYKLNLIDEEDQDIFPLMVNKRNLIVHIYNEDDAYEIYLLIKNTFVNSIERIFENIKDKIKDYNFS